MVLFSLLFYLVSKYLTLENIGIVQGTIQLLLWQLISSVLLGSCKVGWEAGLNGYDFLLKEVYSPAGNDAEEMNTSHSGFICLFVLDLFCACSHGNY